MERFRLVILNQVPILEQLRLEEALLRTTSENWCLVNTGAPPAIVMGISGKPEKLIDLEKVAQDRIPIIKRFSGGGTVYIDPQTVFVTWICDGEAMEIPIQPKSILKWSEKLYQPLIKNFSLKENDYALGERKCGGNALYIQKSRWLLHSSLLWDYDQAKMNYLLMPEKRPEYRQNRSHADFLCTLKPLFVSKEELISQLTTHIRDRFTTEFIDSSQLNALSFAPHRMATVTIN